jgi:hypothetical protein
VTHLDRWSRHLSINNNDGPFDPIGGYAMRPKAIGYIVGTIVTSPAHGQVLLHLENIETFGGWLIFLATSSARMISHICDWLVYFIFRIIGKYIPIFCSRLLRRVEILLCVCFNFCLISISFPFPIIATVTSIYNYVAFISEISIYSIINSFIIKVFVPTKLLRIS